jgi:hypothetical protein
MFSSTTDTADVLQLVPNRVILHRFRSRLRARIDSAPPASPEDQRSDTEGRLLRARARDSMTFVAPESVR